MNERENVNEIKDMAKIMAKNWIFTNSKNMYPPTTDRNTNNNRIERVKLYFNLVAPHLLNHAHGLFSFYMIKYIAKNIIERLEKDSEKISYNWSNEKPKSRGV